MIVVDTSALMAIILNEAAAGQCRTALGQSAKSSICAATLVEAFVVSDGRGLRDQMKDLVTRLRLEIVDLTPVRARFVADAYRRWGKCFHRASLNFGDCFSYALAQELNCPLLYVGNDFAQTDIVPAIGPIG